MENSNPVIYEVADRRVKKTANIDDDTIDPIDKDEVFDHIRDIQDPEHDLTLEQLNVLSLDNVKCDEESRTASVFFKPTIPTCSTASIIGLSIMVKLMMSLPSYFKITVNVYPESHHDENAINKQINDKERVLATMENPQMKSYLKGLWRRYML